MRCFRFDLSLIVKTPEVMKGQIDHFLAKRFFANNLLSKNDSKIILKPLCFSRQAGSNGISYDLKRSI